MSVPRVGPAFLRECWECEGVGRPGCFICKGTGRVVTDLHPFVTLEALVENAQTAAHMVATNRDPSVSLKSVEEYASALFQQLVWMLPEEYERTGG